MNTLTLTQINEALNAAFQATLALTQPRRVAPQEIGDNATLRTDVYTGPHGSGFVVVAVVDLPWRKLVISRQHGPETHREQPAPTLASLMVECHKARAKCYDAEASVYDLADAETKLASSDSALQAEGMTQKAAVLSKRLEIKAEIPKPE
ncbi:MAG: hypothetical protein WCO68_08415 [Verrucomicrobiota bacterium]